MENKTETLVEETKEVQTVLKDNALNVLPVGIPISVKFNRSVYRKTVKGLISQMYYKQTSRSKRRGHSCPTYSKDELISWVKSQDNFESLYAKWVDSNYDRRLTPSVDRFDDYKGYSIDNIQLITSLENTKKAHADRLSGKNNKVSKQVLGINKITGKETIFHSMREAERQTGVPHTSISSYCLGKIKTAGAFSWKLITY